MIFEIGIWNFIAKSNIQQGISNPETQPFIEQKALRVLSAAPLRLI